MSLLCLFCFFFLCVTTRLNDYNEATRRRSHEPLTHPPSVNCAVLPIKLIPRSSTSTAFDILGSPPRVHGLCAVNTMHKGALLLPSHASHMHIRHCSFPIQILCTHRGDVPISLCSRSIPFLVSCKPEATLYKPEHVLFWRIQLSMITTCLFLFL